MWGKTYPHDINRLIKTFDCWWVEKQCIILSMDPVRSHVCNTSDGNYIKRIFGF
jgi:hypothetical protein